MKKFIIVFALVSFAFAVLMAVMSSGSERPHQSTHGAVSRFARETPNDSSKHPITNNHSEQKSPKEDLCRPDVTNPALQKALNRIQLKWNSNLTDDDLSEIDALYQALLNHDRVKLIMFLLKNYAERSSPNILLILKRLFSIDALDRKRITLFCPQIFPEIQNEDRAELINLCNSILRGCSHETRSAFAIIASQFADSSAEIRNAVSEALNDPSVSKNDKIVLSDYVIHSSNNRELHLDVLKQICAMAEVETKRSQFLWWDGILGSIIGFGQESPRVSPETVRSAESYLRPALEAILRANEEVYPPKSLAYVILGILGRDVDINLLHDNALASIENRSDMLGSSVQGLLLSGRKDEIDFVLTLPGRGDPRNDVIWVSSIALLLFPARHPLISAETERLLLAKYRFLSPEGKKQMDTYVTHGNRDDLKKLLDEVRGN